MFVYDPYNAWLLESQWCLRTGPLYWIFLNAINLTTKCPVSSQNITDSDSCLSPDSQQHVPPNICMLWLLLKALDRNWLLWDMLVSENQFIIPLFIESLRTCLSYFCKYQSGTIEMHSLCSAQASFLRTPGGKAYACFFPYCILPKLSQSSSDLTLYSAVS